MAAEPPNVTQAREIALDAGDDVDAGRYQDALDKIVQAEALYHAPTHILIRAEALEGLGRLVEALDTYEDLAAEPLSATAPEAFRKAREDARKRQVALIARVPSLLVLVTGTDVATVTATIDGKPFALGADVAVRVDPGKHVLRVEAGDFRTVEQTVELPARGGVVKLKVQLEREVIEPSKPEPPKPVVNPIPPKRTLFVPAIATLGVGAASLIAGSVTGAMTLTAANELKQDCAADGRCPPAVQEKINQGQLLGNISTATFIVGGVAAATGGVLLLVGSPKKQTTGHFEVTPWIAPTMVGLAGRF